MAIETEVRQEHTFLRRLRWWLVLGNGVLVAVLLALVAQWQADILHGEQEDQRNRVQGLALSISQTIAGQMDLVDLGLKNVTQQLQAMEAKATPPPAQRVNAMLAAQRESMPFLDGLMVTDAQGRVRYGDHLDPAKTINLGERAHFQQARAQRKPALIFSEALISHDTQGQMLFAVRRLEHADGSFAGMVSAAIQPERLNRIFSAVELGESGAISLRNGARQILALVIAGKSQDGWFGTTETSPELARALDSEASSGSFFSTVKQDGVERISAFRRAGDYPLMVIVGEGTSSFLLPWRDQVERIALLCALAAFSMAALSVVVYFAIRREVGGRQQLEAALQRSRAWAQASQDGVHILDLNGTIVRASHSLATLLGYHPDYLQGRNLSLITALPLQDLLIPDPAANNAPHKLQTQYHRLDGGLLDVELYVSTIPFSSGALLYCSARDITHFLKNHPDKS
jgi:PAS domain S-box-containing protein